MIKGRDKIQIEELLTRGVSEIIDRDHLEKRLMSGEKMRIKLGIDPTSQNIHLGRTIPLLKLRDFQKLGHTVVLIIGDFTGLIGDTSDKDSERPMLSEEAVRKNLKTYIDQAAKIIDINSAEIHYNSKWLGELKYMDIGLQADTFSLNEFISRENIDKRLKGGRRISLRELLYPLMQGYDSVAIKSDVELGGTDQRFNLLAGRDMQRLYKQEPQDILMNPLIDGLDGRKMSSSFGNTVNLFDESNDMFGKIMKLRDDLIISYFEYCTRISMKQVLIYKESLLNRKASPKDIKMELAYEITKMYQGKEKADEAKKYFISVFQRRNLPENITETKMADSNIIDILVVNKIAKSKSDARRLISQGGIRVNGKTINSAKELIKKGSIIQKGSRHFLKVND